VWLVSSSGNELGQYLYRDEELPKVGQEITVKPVMRPMSIPGPPKKRRARVTSVDPDADVPIRATSL
jgi:hypothetical protein